MTFLSHILNSERETRPFRLLSLVLVSATLYFRADEIALAPALIWIVAFFVYTLILAYVLPWLTSRLRLTDLTTLIVSLSMIDAVVVTAMVHFTGGITTITVILIPLFIMYQPHTSGMVSATLFALLYTGAAFLEEEVRGSIPLLIGQIGLFYLLSWLSGQLAKRILLDRQEKELLQDLIYQMGATHGIRLEAVHLLSNTASLQGAAKDESSMAQFIEDLREMRHVSAVRLARVVRPKAPQVGGITFTLTARLR